jgi:membrane-associated phospholipid phosphatase
MHYWDLIARFGELQILLPAALLVALALLRRPETRALALRWMASLSAALVATTASKVAFIGWGIGWPEMNFTGVSGHAMMAAAVYPLLLGSLASRSPRPGRAAAIGVGCAIALLVGVSRLVVGAHSASEVLAGLSVGGAASAIALDGARFARAVINPVVPAAVAFWLALTPSLAPASQTHSVVTRLSLMLSGRETPYTRGEMIEELRSRQRKQSERTR